MFFVCLFTLYLVPPCVEPTRTCTINKQIIVIPLAVKPVTVGKAPLSWRLQHWFNSYSNFDESVLAWRLFPFCITFRTRITLHEWAGCLQWQWLLTELASRSSLGGQTLGWSTLYIVFNSKHWTEQHFTLHSTLNIGIINTCHCTQHLATTHKCEQLGRVI